jgi:hypothetical protein
MSNPNINVTAGGLLVNVDGLGVFTFAHRSMRNQIAIECEYSRLTEGLHIPTAFLGNLAQMVADLSVLTVGAPKDWGKTPDGKPTSDVSEMDAFDPETLVKIQKVWSALGDKEAEFRSRQSAAKTGEGVGEQADPVVPPEIQAPAD